jgi:SpoVK/Ycf46/Vps4 family AAA+-type ATPase
MKITLILAVLLGSTLSLFAQSFVFLQKLPGLSDSELAAIETSLPPCILRESATRLPGQFNVVILSGTDKTKKKNAVRYLAQRTDATVYRVDLSLLVSDNFQVTKRNLDLVFEIAKKDKSLLYFEEADALFGNRSPVKDAHDRFDNQTTNYFLHLVKKYRGSVIISVSTENNINPVLFEKFVRLVVK